MFTKKQTALDRLQKLIDEIEEAQLEALAFEAKGNHRQAERCLDRAVTLEAQAANL